MSVNIKALPPGAPVIMGMAAGFFAGIIIGLTIGNIGARMVIGSVSGLLIGSVLEFYNRIMFLEAKQRKNVIKKIIFYGGFSLLAIFIFVLLFAEELDLAIYMGALLLGAIILLFIRAVV